MKCTHESQKKRITKICLVCGIPVVRRPSQLKKHTYCSNKCYGISCLDKPSPLKGKHSINKGCFKHGTNHPNWKGGRRKKKDRTGYYILILQPSHPNCDSMGYVPEHRLVMENILGRYLEHGEMSHHINGIKHDNRPQNLMYFPSQSSHMKYHNLIRNTK